MVTSVGGRMVGILLPVKTDRHTYMHVRQTRPDDVALYALTVVQFLGL